MSIFGNIMGKIFGHKPAQAAPAQAPHPAQPQRPANAAAAAQATRPAQAAPQQAQPQLQATAPVDVEAVLSDLAAKSGQPSNWRTSIVDMMKLLGLDSSLANRKELARELGYTGSTDDSATMNIWLHKAVMTQLAKNGGKVPASMRD